ncbi:hypothetical protein MNB_SUP05-5-832 [hydrothermal vent metagenome]|uniref:Uncharacterized protein n=1 Tax=hydrothermal vent metagenome TaxID=652676 RepID=A0A1W1CNX0_9ZZZZ
MKIGVRELVRNSNILEDHDYLDIEDKRTHKYKGLLVSPKYANEVKKILEKKILTKKQQELDELMSYAGCLTMPKECLNMTSRELRKYHAINKYSEK